MLCEALPPALTVDSSLGDDIMVVAGTVEYQPKYQVRD
jgi:hypothetical protein